MSTVKFDINNWFGHSRRRKRIKQLGTLIIVLAFFTGGCWFGGNNYSDKSKENAGKISAMPQIDQPYIVSGLGVEMVYIAPESFIMGSPYNDVERFIYETPHHVTITKGYWIGKFELLQEEYQKLMGNNPSYYKGQRFPVEMVNWNDAENFCQKLTERERAAGRLPAGYVFRLPTEAEWEYAARGGNKGHGYKYSGSNNINNVAWYYENSGTSRLDEYSLNLNKLACNKSRAHIVGQKSPNELGIYDMSGNVSEWCLDWYGDFSDESAVDPTGAKSASCRIIRGGNWMGFSKDCRVSNRDWSPPSDGLLSLGFRIVLAPQIQ